MYPTYEQEPDASHLDHVHVVYTATADMFPGLLTSMVSLSRNLKEPETCTIHIVVPGADLQAAASLVECFSDEVAPFMQVAPRVAVLEMRPLPLNTTGFVAPEDRQRFLDPAIYARNFLHEYLPASVPRAIYLDVDTIVAADVAPLYRIRMQHVVAAFEDKGGWAAYTDCIKLNPGMLPPLQELGEGNSFNNGILVFDLERWRRDETWVRLLKWVPVSRGCMGDQYALNVAVRGRFDRLPMRFNIAPLGHYMMPGALMPKCALDSAVVLHWAGNMKPWSPVRNRHYDRLVRPYAPRGARCRASLSAGGGGGGGGGSLNELYGGAG